MNFIDKCIEGLASPEDIDGYIDEWHGSLHAETLHDFLGMTWKEYSRWVQDPEYIHKILESRVIIVETKFAPEKSADYIRFTFSNEGEEDNES